MGKNIHGHLFPIYLIIFFAALFFAISISPPALHFNDEWITANQLNQLGTGHQVITSEGKYGTFIGNQNTDYFTSRANILGYSLFLPVLSLPAYYMFIFMDQGFRLVVLFVWALLPIMIALLAMAFFPRYCRIFSIPWPWILIVFSILGFLLNVRLFTPFTATGLLDPVEVAALIFTDHLLFAFLAVILFFTCRLLFADTYYSIFGVIAIISSSSYIYWASSAKDHMLVTVLFALYLSSIFIILKKEDYRYGILPFMGCGLLAWVRPELGFVIFIATILLYYYHFLLKPRVSFSRSQKLAVLLIPLFVLAGSIPFFINNSLITGDPLTPPYTYMLEQRDESRSLESVTPDEMVSTVANNQLQKSSGVLQLIFKYFQPRWNTLLPDLYRIMFFPSSGMIGILAVCPLLLIGIGLFLLYHVIPASKSDTFLDQATSICIIAFVSVLIAYSGSFYGMVTSQGIGPDMRYLSPLYIPGGFLGIIGIHRLSWFREKGSQLLKQTIGTMFLVTPLLFLGFLIFPPFGGGFPGYTLMTTFSVLTFSAIFLLLQVIRYRCNMPTMIDRVVLGIMLALPLTWNLLLVIMFSITRGNGYPFWLPLLELLYDFFIIPVG